MIGHESRRRAAHTHLAAVCFERGWPWWPWWPSMVGHGSRRLAAHTHLQCRGGHGGHGGHDTRTAPETQRAREDAACRRCGARDAPSARGTGTLGHGRRAATPGGHQSWTNPTILPGYPTSAPGCLATAPRVDFWPVATMATMATMATPAGQPLKKNLDSPKLVGWLSPHSTPRFIFFSSFQLGVAMVAMVATRVIVRWFSSCGCKLLT